MQLVAQLTNKFRGFKFKSQLGYITSVEIDYEIIYTAIISLVPIREWWLSVTGKRICIKYRLLTERTEASPEKKITDKFNITLTVLIGL